MSRAFSGICIGGPYDGQNAVSTAPYLKAAVLQETCAVARSDSDEVVYSTVIVYHHYRLGENLYVWRHESLTERDVLRRLINAYGRLADLMRKCGLRATLPPSM